MTIRSFARRRLGSVRLRITLAATALVAIGLTAASFALVRSVHDNLAGEIRRTNEAQLALVAQQLAQGRAPNQVNLPLDPGAGGAPIIEVRGPGGRREDLNGQRIPVQPPPPPAGQAVRAQQTVATQQGQITLIAQRSLGEVNRTVDSITAALLLGVPALVAAIAALAWYLAGRALRPVESIRAEAAAITATTMHRRVPEPETSDEVGRLAHTMNAMLDRLEDSSTRQRQFISDASHELRSPVAAIRAQLEVALRRGSQADWPQVARRVLDEDARLEVAVGELLELARIEEGADAQAVDVDLDDLVLEEATRVRPVTVDTSQVSAGRVEGDARQLARLVRNLFDNAGAHARRRVAVSVTTREGAVRLVVDDDGPGIPPQDREHVFDRFTRLDEGRARDGGSAGLGLAMVRAIAERHGGTVEVTDAPIGGARFVVHLPAGGLAP
ncbi:MAG TPA: HAMP domain-containing sensor histidine kinase [Acidimicrobiia bacterium]|nr:HAMP domain-containing sensor histidine kinase [Acidimicrobiia bacterium]